MAITKIHAIQATVHKAVSYICNPAKTDESILILLWSSIFVTLVAKKYHESVTLPSGLRMVYDNH